MSYSQMEEELQFLSEQDIEINVEFYEGFKNALQWALAGVKPFGFHAIRHKSAAITFVAKGLSAAQILMGHSRATTTDIYVRSAGLYADHGAILEALSKSVIGQAVSGLLHGAECGADMPSERGKAMPPEDQAPEAFCTQGLVHSRIH